MLELERKENHEVNYEDKAVLDGIFLNAIQQFRKITKKNLSKDTKTDQD